MLAVKGKRQGLSLGATTCSLGPDDALKSPYADMAKPTNRTLETAFLLSGSSELDKRKILSFNVRHCEFGGDYVSPWYLSKANTLWPARFVDPKHTLSKNGINVFTDEYEIGDADITEYQTPYSMQYFEDLSWNLNPSKTVPLGYTAFSPDQKWTINQLIDHPASTSGQYTANTITVTNDRWQKNSVDMSNYLTSRPLLANVIHNPGSHISSSRVVNSRLISGLVQNIQDPVPLPNTDNNDEIDAINSTKGALTGENVDAQDFRPGGLQYFDRDYGHYKTQISKGVMHYQFHNTGDATLVIDYVVHKPKANHAMGKGSKSTVAAAIAEVYQTNWAKKRNLEKSGNLVDTTDELITPLEDQILFDPKFKFLPTSCRLDKLNTANGGQDAGDGTLVGKRVIKDPVFTDIKRGQFYVPAGKKKTFTMRLPAKAYDNTKALYNLNTTVNDLNKILLNEHGYNVMFSICGAKNTTVAVSASVDHGPAVVGAHAAATSFRLYGKYTETVVASSLHDREDNMDQRMKIDVDVVNEDMKKFLRSAKYVDITARERDGRFSLLATEGQLTKKQKTLKAQLKQAIEDMSNAAAKRTASITAGWSLSDLGLEYQTVLIDSAIAIGASAISAIAVAGLAPNEVLDWVCQGMAFIIMHNPEAVFEFFKRTDGGVTIGKAAAFVKGHVEFYYKGPLKEAVKNLATSAVYNWVESFGMERVINNLTMGLPVSFGGFVKQVAKTASDGFTEWVKDTIDSTVERNLMTDAQNELTLEQAAEDIQEDTLYPQIIITDRAWILLNAQSGSSGHSQELADAMAKFVGPIANNDPEDGSFGWTNGQLTAFKLVYGATDSITYSTTAVPVVACQHLASSNSTGVTLIRGQHWYTV